MRLTAEETLTRANLAKTFWGKKIIRAEVRGTFTELDKEKSCGWTTCACGRLDPRLLSSGYEPMDLVLASHGLEFTQHVADNNDPVRAARALVAIEKRATQLLKDMYR